MKAVKSIALKKPIVSMKILEDNRLVVVDSETTIRFFEKQDFKLEGGFKANIHHQRYRTNVVSVSNDASCFATLSSDCKESRLYSTKTKKLITKVDRHHGEASCVGVDPISRYMFSGGDDGKTFGMDVRSGKLVFTLPSHVDTINDIAFSANSNWVATASYDRKISLFNLVTMKPKDKLKAHAAPVMKLKFVSKNRLISVDKNSGVIIWSVYRSKVIERLQGIHDDVTQIAVSGDHKFLFLSSALGYVMLYDLNTYEQLSRNYIKLSSPITALEFDNENNNLLIGTEDGFLMYYNIYEGQDGLKELLKNKQFTDIQKAADDNPVLAYTEIFKLVANLWENTLEKAKVALQNGQKKKAILMLDMFKEIPSKNKIIQKVIKDYDEFEKFSKYAKEGKLALAYGLANTKPIYKDSKLYKSLEKRWKQTFAKAQTFALQPKGAEKAKELLAPYRGISEKTKYIQELLTKGEIYKRFRDALGQKNFTICFELIKQHPFLTEFPDYDTLMSYGDSLYMKSEKLINSGDTHLAIKMLRILFDFPDFKDVVDDLMREIESKQKFYNAIKDNDLDIAYHMMEVNETLQETDDGQKLQRDWDEAITQANYYAVNGDAKSVKAALEKYLNIPSKYMAIATVFAWCYMVQLEDLARSNAPMVKVEEGIKNYLLNFGMLEQIELFYEQFKRKYKDSKLNIDLLTRGSLALWRPAMIVESILE